MEKQLTRIVLKGTQFNELLADHQGRYPAEFDNLQFIVGDIVLQPGKVVLPAHTIFNGNLHARQAEMTSFSCVVNGSADFSGCESLILFGDTAEFHGDLNVSGTGLSTFNHQVDGDLHIHNCPALEYIGPKTRVLGKLDANSCPQLESFHGTVRRDARLWGCPKLRMIGKDAMVGGSVSLDGTPIESQKDTLFPPKLRPTAALPSPSEPLAIRLPKKKTYLDVLENAGIKIPTPSALAAMSPESGTQPTR